MKSKAIVFYAPEQLELREVDLREMDSDDVLIETYWTSVSAGTEKMLFEGKMTAMAMTQYPVIPGYETVGKIIRKGADVPDIALGSFVYVSGSLGYIGVNAAFGGSSQLIVSPHHKTLRVDTFSDPALGLALPLSATALHAVDVAKVAGKKVMILGQGAVGLLVAELAKHFGAATVIATELDAWRLSQSTADLKINLAETKLAEAVAAASIDVIIDCTGSMKAIEESLNVVSMNAVVVMAGFYQRLDLAYHTAFMKELTFISAKQWQLGDLERVRDLITRGKLNVKKIFTHHQSAWSGTADAYHTAFTDLSCLKMVLNWM
jgi:bacteriochlorophyllide a dehydrogenase